MRSTSTDTPGDVHGEAFDPDLVKAAQQGDWRARERLVAESLPLVHTIAFRCLPDGQDSDDVVQDTLLAALRDLPSLQDPSSYRAWLTVIAVRQVGAHLRRRQAERPVEVDLRDAETVAIPDLELDEQAAVERELSRQRRQVARAARWLDPDDKVLLSLWWLETAGQLSRADLAAAIGIGAGHAAVRVKRMRGQLDLARALVAALETRPRCPGLAAAASRWDGAPSPLWRKRLSRHVRDCRSCSGSAKGHLSADWLLLGPALLPAPVALGIGLAAKLGSGAAAGSIAITSAASAHPIATASLVSRAARILALHPVAAATTAGTLVTGAALTTAVYTADLPPVADPPAPIVVTAPPAPTPTVTVTPTPKAVRVTAQVKGEPAPADASDPTAVPSFTPSPDAGSPGIPVGAVSLEASKFGGSFVTVARGESLARIAAAGDPGARRRATLEVVPGLGDPACISLRYVDGRYLRHRKFKLEAWVLEPTALYRADATFCPVPSPIAGTVRLRSLNYPDRFLRHKNFMVQLDPAAKDDRLFVADSSWYVRQPLAP